MKNIEIISFNSRVLKLTSKNGNELVLSDSKRYYKVAIIKIAKGKGNSVYDRGSISNQRGKYGSFNKSFKTTG